MLSLFVHFMDYQGSPKICSTVGGGGVPGEERGQICNYTLSYLK